MKLEWQLMRLFVGEPVWTAYNRPQENHPAREEYVKKTMMTHKHMMESLQFVSCEFQQTLRL